MKLILLNPKIDADHQVSQFLQERGAALIFAADPTEVSKLLELHGESIDLLILHLEDRSGKTGLQLELVKRMRSAPATQDLPIVITTDTWGDAECAAHQDSPEGVNAYLHSPFSASDLWEIVQTVLGVPSSPESPATSASRDSPQESQFVSDSSNSGPTLEEPSSILEVPEGLADSHGSSIPSFTLESPDTGLSLDTPDLGSSGESIISNEVPSGGDLFNSEITPLPLPEPTHEVLDTLAALEAPAALTISEMSVQEPEINLQEQSPELNSEPNLQLGQSEPYSEDAPAQNLDSGFDLSQDSGQLPSSQSEDAADEPPELDPEAAQEMPYLLESIHNKNKKYSHYDPALLFAEPVGDAVVPGGAAQTPDLETFKKYLLLREQDVAVLSNQLKAAKEQMELLQQTIREEKAKNSELTHVVNEQKARIENFNQEKETAILSMQAEMLEHKFQAKAKADKARVLENQVRDVSDEMEHLKERVRIDIRKIRVREKELENRLEILKKDSEALLNARETKIIELKRKLDLLEFNMDLLQDQYNREKEVNAKLRERLSKAAQVVQMAGGLLDSSKGQAAVAGQELLSDLVEAGIVKEKAS